MTGANGDRRLGKDYNAISRRGLSDLEWRYSIERIEKEVMLFAWNICTVNSLLHTNHANLRFKISCDHNRNGHREKLSFLVSLNLLLLR